MDLNIFTVILSENIARESRIYSYEKSFNGFVARLLPQEAQRLSGKGSIIICIRNFLIRFSNFSWRLYSFLLICRGWEYSICVSKHYTKTSHDKIMGFSGNDKNDKAKSIRERYHSGCVRYRLVGGLIICLISSSTSNFFLICWNFCRYLCQISKFNDKGFGPPPAKWKGKCVTGRNFTGCNKYTFSLSTFMQKTNTWGHNLYPELLIIT